MRADDGTWNSAATSAYPADLNLFVAEAILQRIIIRETALADEVKLDLAPLLAEDGYTLGRAYAVSKVCQLSGAFELNRRYSEVCMRMACAWC